jgi:hypothetical protein
MCFFQIYIHGLVPPHSRGITSLFPRLLVTLLQPEVTLSLHYFRNLKSFTNTFAPHLPIYLFIMTAVAYRASLVRCGFNAPTAFHFAEHGLHEIQDTLLLSEDLLEKLCRKIQRYPPE